MGPFASALGRKYGKRPQYVFASLMGLIGTIVSEVAKDYNTLCAGRVLQGIGIAAYESLAVSSIGDLFFVHERGPRVAVIIFLLAGISNGISIIAGVITQHLGWNYNFHILLPFAALQTIAVILYCPETAYRRKSIYEIDTAGSDENLEKLAKVESAAAHHHEHQDNNGTDIEKTMTSTTQVSIETIPPKKTFMQNMSLYNGTFVDDSVFKMIIASIAILLNLGATYQVLMTGVIIAWYVAIAITSGVIFASPPYLLSSSSVGYMSVGPFIGGLLGAAFSFVISEPLVRSTTRRNRGVYEPEFSLIPVGLGGVLSVAGLVGWGYAVAAFKSIYLVCFIWGLILFGMTVIASFATQWALDAYRQNSTEVFVMNM
jgi:MFS family permease